MPSSRERHKGLIGRGHDLRLASSRIRHGGRPLSASHRKCISLSEIVPYKNNLLTELARAVQRNIGPRLVSGYNFLLSEDGLKYLDDRDAIHVQFSKLMSNKFPTIF